VIDGIPRLIAQVLRPVYPLDWGVAASGTIAIIWSHSLGKDVPKHALLGAPAQ
jgi:hypothetical protein